MVHHSLNKMPSFNNSHLQIVAANPAVKTISHSCHLQEALESIKGLGLEIEICGDWIWIFGANESHETLLRSVGFQWSYRRGCWYYCPKQDKPLSHCSTSPYKLCDMDKIRTKYGSQVLHV